MVFCFFVSFLSFFCSTMHITSIAIKIYFSCVDKFVLLFLTFQLLLFIISFSLTIEISLVFIVLFRMKRPDQLFDIGLVFSLETVS